MSYLEYLITLNVGQHIQVFGQSSKRVVGSSAYCDAALKAIGVVVYDSVESIGSAAHCNVPQQSVDMNINGIRTFCLSIVACAVVSLSQHDAEIAHGSAPLLRYSVSLRRKRKCVLSTRVSQSVCQVGNCVVQSQTANRIFHFLGLFFLVLSSSLFCPPIFFFLQIYFVHVFYFTHPRIY